MTKECQLYRVRVARMFLINNHFVFSSSFFVAGIKECIHTTFHVLITTERDDWETNHMIPLSAEATTTSSS